jgi:hypothetical protein
MEATNRRLFYIPIIHTEADMGGLRDEVRTEALKRLGLKSWKRKQDFTDRMWERIETLVRCIYASLGTLRLYQDGLPECGREKEIVKDLADSGSRNHRLLLELVEKGAILMGTESPLLLVQEYQLIREKATFFEAREHAKINEHQKKMSRRILRERDIHIANRINETLRTGETGILFLGMLHNLDGLIEKNIDVVYPLLNVSGYGAGVKNGRDE